MNSQFIDYIPESMRELSDNSLLESFDNPRNFDVKDCRNTSYNHKFPDSVLVSLTHGTFAVSSKARKMVKKTIGDTSIRVLRLLKNYSDFGTRLAINKSGIPKKSIIIPSRGRLPGDPARSHKKGGFRSGEFLSDKDFGDIKLLDNPEELRDEGEESSVDYHTRLGINTNLKLSSNGGYILFDFHDTGVRIMDKDPQKDKFRSNDKYKGFPLMTLGTLDGQSCNPEILDYFAERVEYYLGIKPERNTPFKGGYVTHKYGKEKREKLKEAGQNPGRANVIQIELARYLYIKESTQEVDHERMAIIGEGLKRAMADTGIKFGDDYFKAGMFGDDYQDKKD